jgi:hypothetical protein
VTGTGQGPWSRVERLLCPLYFCPSPAPPTHHTHPRVPHQPTTAPGRPNWASGRPEKRRKRAAWAPVASSSRGPLRAPFLDCHAPSTAALMTHSPCPPQLVWGRRKGVWNPTPQPPQPKVVSWQTEPTVAFFFWPRVTL